MTRIGFARTFIAVFALVLSTGSLMPSSASAANITPPQNLQASVKYCTATFTWIPAHVDGFAPGIYGDNQMLMVRNLSAGNQTSSTILHRQASTYTWPGLQPYSTYQVWLYAYVNNPYSPNDVASKPIQFRTGACSPFNPL
jgi:hypothetical protein